jgi:DNA-directed RNA polymerase specialized sigma24 family protein
VIPDEINGGPLQKRNATFATTHWSVVLRAGNLESPQAAEALEELCRVYWYPLYAFIRACGYGPDDAEDLTQGFFERLLQENLIHQAQRDRGRFRSFLLTLLKHYLANDWKRVHREKRGGCRGVISFDQMAAEERYRWEPVETVNPESIYERRWTLTLMSRVLARLRREYRACDKEVLFDRLKSTLSGESGARTDSKFI